MLQDGLKVWVIIIGYLSDFNNVIICWMHRISNGTATYPISYTTMAMPMNNVEYNIIGGSAGWSYHYVDNVNLTSCRVANADNSNYNNLLVIGY